jgi:type I restriction enzyme R subunit
VQTLSRLNRTHAGKEDTFILDFVNETSEILEAFKPYYEKTTIGEEADPRQLYELQAKMDAKHIYYKEDVEGFCRIFFKNRFTQSPSDHAIMNSFIDPAVARFEKLDKDAREEFRSLLYTFRNLYAFLSQIIPYQDSDLEKLYTYIRFLINKLPRRDNSLRYNFDDEVALKYYRLQKISEGRIELKAGESAEITGPTAVGTSMSESPKVELSRLIDIINEKFGTAFTPADQLFFDQAREEAAADTTLQQVAFANAYEGFHLVFRKALENLFIDRMEQNESIFARYMNDTVFRKLVEDALGHQVYDQIRSSS